MRDHLGFFISDIARLFRKRFEGEARALGVTGPQWRVMFTLTRQPGINQSQLADILEVEPITTCRMVDRMEQAGLAERRRDPRDRRAWQIHLTDAALPMMEQLRAWGERTVTDALAGMTDKEVDELTRLLAKVRDNLLTPPADGDARADGEAVSDERTVRHG